MKFFQKLTWRNVQKKLTYAYNRKEAKSKIPPTMKKAEGKVSIVFANTKLKIGLLRGITSENTLRAAVKRPRR